MIQYIIKIYSVKLRILDWCSGLEYVTFYSYYVGNSCVAAVVYLFIYLFLFILLCVCMIHTRIGYWTCMLRCSAGWVIVVFLHWCHQCSVHSEVVDYGICTCTTKLCFRFWRIIELSLFIIRNLGV